MPERAAAISKAIRNGLIKDKVVPQLERERKKNDITESYLCLKLTDKRGRTEYEEGVFSLLLQAMY